MCGVITTLGNFNMGSSLDIGSGLVTSNPAPHIVLLTNASYKSF